MTMTVIRKPPNAPTLFGGLTLIMIGAFDREGMRRWQERLRTQEAESEDGEDGSTQGVLAEVTWLSRARPVYLARVISRNFPSKGFQIKL